MTTLISPSVPTRLAVYGTRLTVWGSTGECLDAGWGLLSSDLRFDRIRPSWSAINTSMVIPSASSLDTLGFMARSPELMKIIGNAWETDSNTNLMQGNFSLPKKIFFPVRVIPSLGQLLLMMIIHPV